MGKSKHWERIGSLRRTKECAAQTREAILDAAERVFFRQGVATTTLSQIACEASLTRGAIYWHFSGKLELVKAMQERACLPQEQFFQPDLFKTAEDPLDQLHRATADFLDFIPTDRRGKCVYTILFLRCEYVGEMQEALKRWREEDARFKQLVEDVFERAAEEGRLARYWIPSVAANVYVSALTGLVQEWLRSDESFDLPGDGRALLGSLFQGFANPCRLAQQAGNRNESAARSA